ncbi:methionine--trna cytoplasmic-like protein [Lasius niger]|uniref:Methionine--trna cytoplasmic-like protein n=1 Tax=Lasius niger TaxID=67767 RepID=A0A0J7K8E0_LASNI|nr:methionine--trna cytoplasmic-like protein [Lasius niger]
MPASLVSAAALEWIEDIDVIRAGSGSLQGNLSGKLRKRVAVLSEVIRTLSEKIEDTGDPAYLRRNAELAAELTASKRETAKLRSDVTDLQKIVQELKSSIGPGDKVHEKAGRATSTVDFPFLRQRSQSRDRKGKAANNKIRNNVPVSTGDVVMRPPLKGVSTPIPAVERSTVLSGDRCSSHLTRDGRTAVQANRRYDL